MLPALVRPLPSRNELRELHDRLAEERKLDASILTLLRIAPRHALPMDVLRTAVSALSFYDPEFKKNDHDANVDKAIRLTSQIAMIVAAYDRIRKGRQIVRARPDSLSHAANFLLMLNGKAPTRIPPNVLSTSHSSFMRIMSSTPRHSPLVSRRPPSPTCTPQSPPPSARSRDRSMAVPTKPSSTFLKQSTNPAQIPSTMSKACWPRRKRCLASDIASITPKIPAPPTCVSCRRDLGKSSGQGKWFEFSHKIEEFVKADKKLNANVDFYSASTYHTLGIDVDLFTPMFADFPHQRMGRPCHRATRRQPPDPAPRRIPRPRLPKSVRPNRPALMLVSGGRPRPPSRAKPGRVFLRSVGTILQASEPNQAPA